MRKIFFSVCLFLLSCSMIVSCVNPNSACNCNNCQCNKPTEELPKEDDKEPIIQIVPFGKYECIARETWRGSIVQRNEDKEYLNYTNNMTITDNLLSGDFRDNGLIGVKLNLEVDGKFTGNENYTWKYNYGTFELHYKIRPHYHLQREETIFYFALKKN